MLCHDPGRWKTGSEHAELQRERARLWEGRLWPACSRDNMTSRRGGHFPCEECAVTPEVCLPFSKPWSWRQRGRSVAVLAPHLIVAVLNIMPSHKVKAVGGGGGCIKSMYSGRQLCKWLSIWMPVWHLLTQRKTDHFPCKRKGHANALL